MTGVSPQYFKDETGSLECLGIYLWTCAHNQAVRRSRDRFEQSLDTVSRKISHITEVICRWAHSILVLADSSNAGVNWQLGSYVPFFDGCIGALDGTHVKVRMSKEAKIDHINRKRRCKYKCLCNCRYGWSLHICRCGDGGVGA